MTGYPLIRPTVQQRLPDAPRSIPKTALGQPMSNRALHIALIGNAPPRRCGIASFTADLELALRNLPEVAQTAIVALNDPSGHYAYSPKVRCTIAQENRADYRKAAHFILEQGFDVACLQHEFGIFGGEAGEYVLDLVDGLRVPLVSTLHTVLDRPSGAQERVMRRVLDGSARVVVMAQKGRQILIERYGYDPARIAVIAHGIPDLPWAAPNAAKARLGFAARPVILTFGLIGPSKGIETMIEAMPAVLARAPDALYVVMGATHPHLLRDGHDLYRDALRARVAALGLDDHVLFLNRFAARNDLLDHVAMCDVYVTPYLEEAQMTSGTLAISHGMGRAVVSTPFWHAAELLGDGSGLLVPFGHSGALGAAVAGLLGDEPRRLAMAHNAYAASRASIWKNSARQYARLFAGLAGVCGPLRVAAGSI
jgi:glycosyltransferase involved in cell wall biosynthesis